MAKLKQGERGERGVPGPAGPPGPTGMIGPIGAVGRTGARGAKGATGSKASASSKGRRRFIAAVDRHIENIYAELTVQMSRMAKIQAQVDELRDKIRKAL